MSALLLVNVLGDKLGAHCVACKNPEAVRLGTVPYNDQLEIGRRRPAIKH